MANETTYDVYTFARGRWILDTRFKKHQRERAIDEGKQLEKQPGIESVKVVREIYNQSDSLISERIVYKTQGEAIGGVVVVVVVVAPVAQPLAVAPAGLMKRTMTKLRVAAACSQGRRRRRATVAQRARALGCSNDPKPCSFTR